LDVNYYRFFKVLPTATSMFSKQYQLLPCTNALSDWFKYLDLDVDRFLVYPKALFRMPSACSNGWPIQIIQTN